MTAWPTARVLVRGLRRRGLQRGACPIPRLDGWGDPQCPGDGHGRRAATGGYWLVASDGGIFSFDAPFYGAGWNGSSAPTTARRERHGATVP